MKLTPRRDRPAGGLAFSHTADPAELRRRESAAGEAIQAGRPPLGAALEFFRSRGVPRVVLLTAERNAAAQRLFAGAGFRPTMIEMTRELDDPAS
jgi:hypothetical protein